MNRRPRIALAVAASLGLIIVCGLGGVTLHLLEKLQGGGADPDISDSLGSCGTLSVAAAANLPDITSLSVEQVRNAAIIVQVGQRRNVPPRGWVIAIATAMQESGLHNLPNLGPRNDHDSLGLFQQRPSAGWGTPAQIMNPVYAAGKFYAKLVTVPGWQTMTLTDAAQQVQRSAFPDAYAKREPAATAVVASLTDASTHGALSSLRCEQGALVAASGWTVPLVARISSGFRPKGTPVNMGIDLDAPRGTPVRAAAAGVVIAAACDAHTRTDGWYGCDVDGSAQVDGCGWWVEIQHAGNVITRYCHLGKSPDVVAGQQISAGQTLGVAGASGRATRSGCHFEIHVNGDRTASGAVDPVAFMRQRGARLGETS